MSMLCAFPDGPKPLQSVVIFAELWLQYGAGTNLQKQGEDPKNLCPRPFQSFALSLMLALPAEIWHGASHIKISSMVEREKIRGELHGAFYSVL